MNAHAVAWLSVLAGLLAAADARAQGAVEASGPLPAEPVRVRAAQGGAGRAAGAQGPARVRSSHTVDVIAPGETVETVLDRMRARGPDRGGESGRGERPGDVRAPGVRGPDGGGPGDPGKDGRPRRGDGRGPGRDGRGDGRQPPAGRR